MNKEPDQAVKILLTGKPGCGKTTVIMKLAGLLKALKVAGFYTEQIRSGGQRTGFSVCTFRGAEGVLSSVNFRQGPQVGKYRVDVAGLEKIIAAEFDENRRDVDVYIIDEIGKMECYSNLFVRTVRNILRSNIPLVATVALKGSGFIEEVKAHPGIELIEVIMANRDELPKKITARLSRL